MKPVATTADKSILTAGGFNVSVMLTSELVEPFMQKLQQITGLTVKRQLVYVYRRKKLWNKIFLLSNGMLVTDVLHSFENNNENCFLKQIYCQNSFWFCRI